MATKRIPAKTLSVMKIHEVFGAGAALPILLEIAVTGTISKSTQEHSAQLVRQMADSQDLDMIVEHSGGSRLWGLRPNGRKELAQANSLLHKAISMEFTRR